MKNALLKPERLASWIILLAAFALLAGLFITFFERIPIKGTSFLIDWSAFWNSIRDGNVVYYSANGLRIPPWSVLFIMPLGFVSLRASWGLLALITITILVISVPRRQQRWRYWASTVLLVASFLTLRVIVDGNFEGFIIGGVLLIGLGYHRRQALPLAVGILMATVKPQAVFLLIGAVGLYLIVLREWKLIVHTALIVLVVVAATMFWRGQDWLTALGGQNATAYTGNLLDITLAAALKRLGVSPAAGVVAQVAIAFLTLLVVWYSRVQLSRPKMGLLLAASILCAPYAAGNSVLTVVAIGIIPLFQKRPLPGIVLILLVDFALLLNQGAFIGVASYYWTFFTLLSWITLAWHVVMDERQPVAQPMQTQPQRTHA